MRKSAGGVSGRAAFLLSAMGVSAAAAFGAPALAQEADGDRTITVVGQRPVGEDVSDKTTAPMLDMPLTIDVIPEEIFAQQGARNLTDVLRNTTGITFNAGENGFTSGLSNFSMRGFDATGDIFIDGVRDSGNYMRDAFNIEQVEVFKGPVGDNGRGGAGGYVNVVTKSPVEGAHYSIIASYGFDDTRAEDRQRIQIDLNQPFSPRVAGRLNILMEDGGVAGRDMASLRTFAIAPSITFGMGTPSQLTFSAQHMLQESLPDWGVPAALIDGMLRFDPAIDHEGLRDVFYGLASDYDDVNATSALVRWERTFGDGAEFTTQVRWSRTERATAYTLATGYTPATGVVATQRQFYERENESLSWLSNLSFRFNTGALSHRAAVGVEIAQEEASAFAFPTQTNPGGTVLIGSPDPYRAGVATIAPTQRSVVDVNTVAAYFYDTIELSPQWQITGGGRVEAYEVQIASRTIAGAPLGANGLTIEETTWSGRFGAVYKPAENLSIYGAVGVASLPPASFLSNPDISREGDNAFPGYSVGMNSRNAAVQRSINYEIGVKGEWFGGRLNAEAALFHTTRENVAITGVDPTILPPPPVALLGYGEQIVQGAEFSVTGELTDNWSVFAGLLLMESERNHSAFLDEARRLANPGDYGAVLRTSGDALAFTPEVSANLWTTYAFPFGLTVGGGVRYVGESYVGRPDNAERIIANGVAGVLPEYWVADALIEYEITENAIVRLNINNVTDELYAVSTNWPAQRVLLGPPRSFMLSFQLRM